MPRSLLLLVGSANTGAYINTLAYAVEQLRVEQIVMVNILYAPLGRPNAFEDLVNRELQGALSKLAQGRYESKQIPLEKRKLYGDISDKYEYRHIERINYHFLRKEIRRMRNVYGEESIVDITSLPKRLAIDVLTACLAENMYHVMLFELKKQGGYLYHELEGNDYEYIPLPDWSPLLSNIEVFSARRNRQKFISIAITIWISLFIVILNQLGLPGWGGWLMAALLVGLNVVGALLPLVEALGGINLRLAFWRRS
ncbi:hypothetical protein [Thermogemmatispora sp.]|uniref:hypothetical protein n=1 Tax=Thermogemmatispora sp. TaxID=1968838 RepID=UPI002ACBF990|nr:hypothetical protein [Thermogemmatispora sp.]